MQAAAAGLALVALGACGGGGEDPPPDPPAGTPPVITSQPTNATAAEGATAMFSVTATGTGLSYQWRKNGAAIAGATAATHTTPATAAADDNALFTVVVSNSTGSVTSNPATLHVSPTDVTPSIVTDPASIAVVEGATATFTVVANGTAPAYQWRKNGNPIAGATSASYTTPPTTPADNAAQFTVVVSNSVGTATSGIATLTVTNQPAVAPSFTSPVANRSVTEGATATFSAAVTGTAPFTYQWRKNGAQIAGATAAAYTTPATVLADNGALFSVVVTGPGGTATSADATLTVTPVVTAPSITTSPAAATASVGGTATFSVVATGTGPLTYQWRKGGVAIAGATAASYTTGTLVQGDNNALFSVVVTGPGGVATSADAKLTVAPAITTQPANQTALNGAAASFSVVATGSATLSYQWRKDGTAITGATSSTYTIPAVTFHEDGALYTVVVTNGAGSVTSSAGRLTVTLPPSTVSQLAAGQTHSVAVRSNGTVFTWAYWGAAVYNNRAGAGALAFSPGTAVRARNVDNTPFLGAVSAAAGINHTVVLKTDGTVWAWGDIGGAVYGECPIGDGVCVARNYPTQVRDADGVPFTQAKQVVAGEHYSVALRTDGSVWSWGTNYYGQLGIGTVGNAGALNPVAVLNPVGGALTGVSKVAAGPWHALALKTDGTVVAWGRNQYGQLGDGAPTATVAVPRTVEISAGVPLSNVVAIAAGATHSVALLADGSVYAWGYNVYGALGDGTTINRPRAALVKDSNGVGITGITAISAGEDVSVYLRSDNTVLTSGRNQYGQLGDNTNAASQINPVPVRDAANAPFTGVNLIATSLSHTLVRRSDDSVWAWGLNTAYQVGDTTNVNRRNPVPIPAGN
jgi:alpha-tubulin suppressor-like RCC1 family protein